MMNIKLALVELVCLQLVMGQHQSHLPLVSVTTNESSLCKESSLTGELKNIRQMVNDTITELTTQCGSVLWHRVAFLNMSDSKYRCPAAWMVHNNNGVVACRRPTSDRAGCSGHVFQVSQLQYSKVCGRIIGYQFRSPDGYTDPRGFYRNVSIDSPYMDGVSLTRGTPRKHIWSFAAGVLEQNRDYGCPCVDNYEGPPNPVQPFVGDNYYCESGNYGDYYSDIFYRDKLWDGQQCSTEGTCCSAKSPPWFNVQLANVTNDNIEVRICGDESTSNEGTPVELIEIYVQ